MCVTEISGGIVNPELQNPKDELKRRISVHVRKKMFIAQKHVLK